MLTALVVVFRSVALLCCGHRAVAVENLALRQQLAVFRRTVKRPPLRAADRLCWILLSKAWRDWRTALVVMQPETVVRWHRQWLRRRWTRRSTHARPGRPRTDAAIRALVEEMRVANPLWGAPRVHGELKKLGIDVSQRTVSRLMRSRQRPPSQTWHTFLTNHLTSLVSMDFFTVPTLTGRVLFVVARQYPAKPIDVGVAARHSTGSAQRFQDGCCYGPASPGKAHRPAARDACPAPPARRPGAFASPLSPG